ncbi:MAG TPA: class I SAM-dependent methyltransferase, partial [Desulfotomaculum sp.]|nr:class I SAM-dependent methyltransferase [Desulfotomaculum sp.]
MGINRAYDQVQACGLYQKPPGLRGKYDNVRRFWEDELTRRHLQPYLVRLLKRQTRIRICDLGCGSGDGYELLTDAAKPYGRKARVIPRELVEVYTGIDINPGLLAQAGQIFGRESGVRFEQADFRRGLPVAGEPPYHIYLANYGTLSHCRDRELVDLLAQVADQAADGSLIIADWLGCFAYEWQDFWVAQPPPDYMIPYVISYFQDNPAQERPELDVFDLRLMHPATLRNLIREVSREAGVSVQIREIFDRSIFVGRHIETAEYHPHPQPLRTLVNSLFERDCHTDLAELIVHYEPKTGFDELNAWFCRLQAAWNALVRFADELLAGKAP